MTGWTPLYQQIVASSIWGAPDHVRLAWITLLAVANKQGVAVITEGGLARLAVISRENAADALRVLSEPDPDTLTQSDEGRRIERVENGWKLLNFQKYRELAKTQAVREANAEAQARWRASQAAKSEDQEPKSSTRNNGKKKAIAEGYLPAGPMDDVAKVKAIRDGLCGLFDRNPVDNWTYAEESALVEVAKRSSCLDELSELRCFQRSNGQYFPQSIHSLLEGWTRALDRARSFEREPSNKPPKTLMDKELESINRQLDNL